MTTLRAVLAAAGQCNDTAKNYFRQLNAKTLVSDLKFAAVCVVGDMFFVKTSSSSDLNHLPYSNATEFELGPVLMQSGLSALSMVEGAVTGFGGCALLLGGVYLGEYFYDRCTRKSEIDYVDAGGPTVEEVVDEDEHPARLACSPAVWDMTEYVNDEAHDEERMYASQQRQSFLSRSLSRCANSQCAIL